VPVHTGSFLESKLGALIGDTAGLAVLAKVPPLPAIISPDGPSRSLGELDHPPEIVGVEVSREKVSTLVAFQVYDPRIPLDHGICHPKVAMMATPSTTKIAQAKATATAALCMA